MHALPSPLRLLVGWSAWLAASAAWAQSVTVIPLGTGPGNSIAYGAGGGQQVGHDGAAAAFATLWTGSAGSAVSLNPAGAVSSTAFATDGTQQGGHANFTGTNGTDHAALWAGTAGSFIDLHPAGAGSSVVVAVHGGQQGGAAFYGGLSHAVFWGGSAASASDLHPAGATESSLTALTATRQGGSATFAGDAHAGWWSGTAGSFIDLHPAGASLSQVLAMDATSQAGAAYFGSTPHAARWSDTAGSFTDLNPAGASGSIINALAGPYQAGLVFYGSVEHAAVWAGSTATFHDYHGDIESVFGAGYTASLIRGAEWSGGTLWLAGEAFNPVLTESRAFLLAVAIPETATTTLGAALVALAVAGVRRRRRAPDPS